MNAHKFVAEHGVEEAKRVLEGAPDWANFWISRDQYHGHIISFPNMTGHYSIKLSELKQVVESLDMVAKHGGLFCLKCQIEKGGYDFEWYGENGEFGFTDLNVLEKAIADYELFESFKYGALTNKGTKCEVLDLVDVSPRCEVRNG